MLNQRLIYAPEANQGGAPQGGRSSDPKFAALMVRTILQAASSLKSVSCETAATAADAETEHLAVTNLEAAELALYTLSELRRRLARSIEDVRATHGLSLALIRAADKLPGGEIS
ncbi:MAG TPA: hypothetical protein VGL58_06580 [Caulobacteraceae bacterium]|jgi:hypothetical protein